MNEDDLSSVGRHVLTLNAGSSSLKLAVFTAAPPIRKLCSGAVSRIGLPGTTLAITAGTTLCPQTPVDAADHARALEAMLAHLEPHFPLARAAAVGHRVVHGGPRFDSARLVTPEVLAELRRLSPLDVDHLPAEIAIAEAMARRAPQLPQVACFDTSFHRTMPRVARLIAVPRR
jgi:acetate kinase